MKPELDCYSGRTADERRVRFRLDGHESIVEEVLDQWYGSSDVFLQSSRKWRQSLHPAPRNIDARRTLASGVIPATATPLKIRGSSLALDSVLSPDEQDFKLTPTSPEIKRTHPSKKAWLGARHNSSSFKKLSRQKLPKELWLASASRCDTMAVVGDVLFFLFLVLSLVIGGPVAVYWSYSQVRRKGYRPPAAIFIVLVGMAAGVAGAFALKPGNAWNAPTIFWHVIGVPMVLATAALGVLVLILPRRKARVFGERRTHFPFPSLGRLLQVLAVSVVVLAVIVWMSSGDASGSGPMALLGTMLWAAGRYLSGKQRPFMFLRCKKSSKKTRARLPFICGPSIRNRSSSSSGRKLCTASGRRAFWRQFPRAIKSGSL